MNYQVKPWCTPMHAHACMYILYTRTLVIYIYSNFPVLNREHVGYIESGASSTECVGHVSVDLISSGVDVFLGAEKLNSGSEDQETNNTPIT